MGKKTTSRGKIFRAIKKHETRQNKMPNHMRTFLKNIYLMCFKETKEDKLKQNLIKRPSEIRVLQQRWGFDWSQCGQGKVCHCQTVKDGADTNPSSEGLFLCLYQFKSVKCPKVGCVSLCPGWFMFAYWPLSGRLYWIGWALGFSISEFFMLLNP